MTRIRAAILIFPEIEVLDFCGPFEVFSTVRLNESNRREEPSPFEVYLVAETAEPVAASGGLKVIPDYTFTTAPQADILVVPGGWGTRREVENPSLVEWIQKQAAGARRVMSVCTGAFLLAQAGLLHGKRATTHWRSLERMRETYPDVTVEGNRHWVDDGILSSAGISAGIDLALVVVGQFLGEAIARATAQHMEYRYPESDTRVRS